MADDDEALAAAVEDRTLSRDEADDLTTADDAPVSVTYSTQDYPIDGLVKRLKSGAMLIPQFGGTDDRVTTAGFQRGFVWTKAQMDRFVESLLLGYPIPGIFLVRQSTDNRLLILDGQQRIETLRRFYTGMHEGREFSLANVGDQFRGVTYESLNPDLQRQLDDSYMQATIVTADGSSSVDDAIYQIFERLNSGGTQLTPHEIRVALFAGNFIASIERLNDDPSWRSLYGRKSKRIRDHELVTRILAMVEEGEHYTRPLKQFLNSFVKSNRERLVHEDAIGEAFVTAAEALAEQMGAEAFRSLGGAQVNAAQAEVVMAATIIAQMNDGIPSDLKDRVSNLKKNEDFRQATTRATADKDSVDLRLNLARKAIAEE